MIGKIVTGKSFRGCLNYLHEGRLQPTKELQQLEAAKKQAQVISFNQCFGDKKQLMKQFGEVRLMNPRLSKPVFHATISFAYADSNRLTIQDKADIATELAKAFRFEDNQYVAIAHADTKHEHLHIVANRIGYNGKTASDSNSYKRMAEFGRRMELKYNLTQVLSPNRFLSKQERQEQKTKPRLDNRKELLKQRLNTAIQSSKTMLDVKQLMEKHGYEVELGRGIAFTDQQHVRFKGSQVGFALATIEKKLKQQQNQQAKRQEVQPNTYLKRDREENEIKERKGMRL
ncbi:relaxase/mobilization nuclease domain-containing protein [Mucilaginibacter terrae]|uniref:Uncharacterized protein YqgQ n=1 Tax=Mucilaginibacter terrae TaxID=1955052 RepID=A0ABU3GUZ2_9SPHI|nr:relaxase/mobilization nuclease domain-containing protein [Mucilaginibacter terrae]MDT3403606.1 uncharacterized protein YqgQ [Mucilaginibacter terrae]